MALSIKNREVEELARELARISGKPITEAVRDSLKRELERAKIVAAACPEDDDFVERILDIGRRCAALPVIDNRSADEILGYGEDGLPH
jgi:antitoxin VapB